VVSTAEISNGLFFALTANGEFMYIIGMILIGFLVGLVAKFLMPGREGGGFILTTILGIIGAVVGTYLGQAGGVYQEGEPAGFIFSVLGAMVVLGIARLITGKRA
jgi:uncharacterized membrane protein YeaQ/YmgE (transglycosylase-associated protein family)